MPNKVSIDAARRPWSSLRQWQLEKTFQNVV